jgi:cytochrome P450
MTAEVDSHRLIRENILDILYLLMIAGLDTVASSVSCLLAWLAQHPAERHALTVEPARWPTAIEELMRYESPVFMNADGLSSAHTEPIPTPWRVPARSSRSDHLRWAEDTIDE